MRRAHDLKGVVVAEAAEAVQGGAVVAKAVVEVVQAVAVVDKAAVEAGKAIPATGVVRVVADGLSAQ